MLLSFVGVELATCADCRGTGNPITITGSAGDYCVPIHGEESTCGGLLIPLLSETGMAAVFHDNPDCSDPHTPTGGVGINVTIGAGQWIVQIGVSGDPSGSPSIFYGAVDIPGDCFAQVSCSNIYTAFCQDTLAGGKTLGKNGSCTLTPQMGGC